MFPFLFFGRCPGEWQDRPHRTFEIRFVAELDDDVRARIARSLETAFAAGPAEASSEALGWADEWLLVTVRDRWMRPWSTATAVADWLESVDVFSPIREVVTWDIARPGTSPWDRWTVGRQATPSRPPTGRDRENRGIYARPAGPLEWTVDDRIEAVRAHTREQLAAGLVSRRSTGITSAGFTLVPSTEAEVAAAHPLLPAALRARLPSGRATLGPGGRVILLTPGDRIEARFLDVDGQPVPMKKAAGRDPLRCIDWRDDGAGALVTDTAGVFEVDLDSGGSGQIWAGGYSEVPLVAARYGPDDRTYVATRTQVLLLRPETGQADRVAAVTMTARKLVPAVGGRLLFVAVQGGGVVALTSDGTRLSVLGELPGVDDVEAAGFRRFVRGNAGVFELVDLEGVAFSRGARPPVEIARGADVSLDRTEDPLPSDEVPISIVSRFPAGTEVVFSAGRAIGRVPERSSRRVAHYVDVAWLDAGGWLRVHPGVWGALDGAVIRPDGTAALVFGREQAIIVALPTGDVDVAFRGDDEDVLGAAWLAGERCALLTSKAVHVLDRTETGIATVASMPTDRGGKIASAVDGKVLLVATEDELVVLGCDDRALGRLDRFDVEVRGLASRGVHVYAWDAEGRRFEVGNLGPAWRRWHASRTT